MEYRNRHDVTEVTFKLSPLLSNSEISGPTHCMKKSKLSRRKRFDMLDTRVDISETFISDSEKFQICFSAVHYPKFSDQR